jgi:DNA-binding NtrC family response regulator
MQKQWRDEVKEVERRLLTTALRLSNGNLSQVSRALNMSRFTAREKAKRYKLWPWKKGKR